MSTTPIVPLIVGRNGAWLAVRTSSSQGSCGVRAYPCRHPGLDVVGPAGTPVKAPEDGLVVAAADGSSSPYAGYGPWLVIIRGASGKFHLLGHLDPAYMLQAPIGLRVKEGQIVGRTSSAGHTHWEVRRKMVPDFAHGEDNFDNNVDPLAWASSSSALLPLVLLAGVGLLVYLARRR